MVSSTACGTRASNSVTGSVVRAECVRVITTSRGKETGLLARDTGWMSQGYYCTPYSKEVGMLARARWPRVFSSRTKETGLPARAGVSGVYHLAYSTGDYSKNLYIYSPIFTTSPR